MEVMMLEKRSRPLPSGATQNYPKDWSGDVPEEFARAWINDGGAVAVAGASGAMFTEDQAFVLRHAANQMIENINAEASASQEPQAPAAEQQDGGDGADAGEGDPDEDVIDLAAMTEDALRELAKEANIRSYASMKRETLIAKLTEAMQADLESADGEDEASD